ncbi:MAG TPA: response regulator [Gemmatimonadales bacterium]|nr:response regulator [Gemmatimonadales bacterium]
MTGNQTPRVLVVDNEDVVRVLMARMLRDGGYDVVEAANGRVALDLLGAAPTNHFDVVVTNTQLPGINGFEFVRTMLEQHPQLRVIHISGHPESLDDERFDALDGVVTTLAKPFTSAALKGAVERALEAARHV